VPRTQRLFHHHEPTPFQVPRQVIRRDPHGQLIGMTEPFPTVEGQGEGERLTHVVGIGRREGSGFVWHACMITGTAEQDKNI
jgi:hypothetical protein